jgi:prolyl-tRNA synthetase
MGGSRSEEFLHPTDIGEDTYVKTAGGYAANVEAFVSTAPAALEIPAGQPAVFDSPNTPTIDTLVALANDQHPKGVGSLGGSRHPEKRGARARAPLTILASLWSSGFPAIVTST